MFFSKSKEKFSRAFSLALRRNYKAFLYLIPISLVTYQLNETNNFGLRTTYCAKGKNFYNINEISNFLREKLDLVREKLKNDGMQTPSISIGKINGNIPVDIIALEMKFYPNCNKEQLFSHWLKVLNDEKNIHTQNMNKINQFFYEDKHNLFISIRAVDQKSSMTITKFKDINGSIRVSASLFKDHGLMHKDLEEIVYGYQEAFSKSTQGNFKQMQFPSSGYDNSVNSFFSQLIDPKYILEEDNDQNPFLFKKVPEGNFPVQEAVDPVDKTADPIQQLKTLGVEVFEKNPEKTFNWDFLAGYDEVKRDIEDTIINSVKYPEIYDSITKGTRVIYENNKPKAVLLEGPPGTGKTLTAKILASECNRPLIIIRLDDIVSKWYGESEKKLTKILSLCETLENPIIFIDEVDALTQNRDNQNGIHEVSGRILSVILQHLEGFSGKSKSLFLCATNRAKDLDEALISRFNLVIKYDLPDFDTRVAILKRYAKQFSSQKDVYDRLSQASEGLSCRDIKEACEQAERQFASRLIRKKFKESIVKNKSLLDDADQTTGASASKNSKSSLGFLYRGSVDELPSESDYLANLEKKRIVSRAPNSNYL